MTIDRTLIFIPTFNEASNVNRMCGDVLKLGLDADLVFMDDASPDGTGVLLDELARSRPRVKVIHRPSRLGVGSAHLDGIAHAYQERYTRLVTMDCDFTHSPTKIAEFIEALAGADVVVGSRFKQEGSLPGWSRLRRSLTKIGHAMTERLLDFPQDATSGFRLYDLTKIPRELFGLVRSRGYSFFFESLFILHKNGYRINEVAVKLPARTYGSSKMSLREVQRSVEALGSIYVADKLTPSRFKHTPAFDDVDPNLLDVRHWDQYWSAKQEKTGRFYDAVAAAYRTKVIKKQLDNAIHREFTRGMKLLHAGCGSGQVDVGLHAYADITALDISSAALARYRHENPEAKSIVHGSIVDLPFEDETFDGAYNLGVLEHLHPDELVAALKEVARVLKPDAKFVIFWPHAYASSVLALNTAHWVLNDVLRQKVRLHPPEFSLTHSKHEAKSMLREGGFDMESYRFGREDFFVQAIVVGKRRARSAKDRKGRSVRPGPMGPERK